MPSTNGFILGLVGGLLDFASASLLYVSQSGSAMMEQGPVPDYVWEVGLVVLGVAVVATSVLSVTSTGIESPKAFSILMIVYGAIMLLVGAAMTTGYIPGMGSSVIYSYGMVIVGAAMIANGAFMSRNPMPV